MINSIQHFSSHQLIHSLGRPTLGIIASLAICVIGSLALGGVGIFANFVGPAVGGGLFTFGIIVLPSFCYYQVKRCRSKSGRVSLGIEEMTHNAHLLATRLNLAGEIQFSQNQIHVNSQELPLSQNQPELLNAFFVHEMIPQEGITIQREEPGERSQDENSLLQLPHDMLVEICSFLPLNDNLNFRECSFGAYQASTAGFWNRVSPSGATTVEELHHNLCIHGEETRRLDLKNVRFNFISEEERLRHSTLISMIPFYCPNLRGLNLDQLKLSPTTQRSFANNLSRLTSLTHLNLSGINIDPLSIQDFAPSISSLSSLTSLQLSANSIFSTGVRYLVDSISNLTCLKLLELDECFLKNEGVLSLAFALPHFESLTSLFIAQNEIDAQGILYLSTILSQLVSLKHLDLGDNPFGSEGMRHLSESLLSLSSLSSLRLYNCRLDPQAMEFLASATTHLDHLTLLNLNHNPIGSLGASHLNEGLWILSTLKALLLRNCHLRAEGAVLLSEGINHLTSLVRLDLGDNLMGTGIQTLAPVLSGLTSLEKLYLDINCFEQQSIYLSHSFSCLSSLKILDLGLAAQSFDGAQNLVLSISSLSASLTHLSLAGNSCFANREMRHLLLETFLYLPLLKKLNLAWTSMDAEGACSLSGILSNLAQLDGLYLQVNTIGIEGARSLLPSIGQLRNLRILNLSYNEMSEQEASRFSRELQEVAPRLTSYLEGNDVRIADLSFTDKYLLIFP